MTRIGYLLNRTALQIREMVQEVLKPFGIVPPHLGVLTTLATEGPQTQRALGATLRIDPTTMVWLIDALEKKGWVRRQEHPEDRRAHLVTLSPRGEATFHETAREMDRIEKQFLATLSHKEQDDLRRLLTKLFASVSTGKISPTLFKEAGD